MTLSVSCAFDGGNIRLAGIDGDRIDLEILKDHESDFYQWFYFRVTGAEGRPLTLRILNCAGSAYPHGWKDYRACMSYDREEWRRVDTDYADGVLTIRVTPALNSVWFATLLAEVVDAAAAKTAVPIALAASSGMPDLRGDRVLLREALLNIISNAAEASESTGGRVDVRARMAAFGAAPTIEIEIADTGPGIPLADLGRVFAPGFTTKESGSGIGLAIAERVVSAHYGRIRLDSEPGQGTRVIVALPCDLGGFANLAAFVRTGGEAV